MTHNEDCGCSECRQLDRRYPQEGRQLAMFEQREQRTPTEEEALRGLFELAGKGAAVERSGQRRMIL
jgi:hypothetical protein